MTQADQARQDRYIYDYSCKEEKRRYIQDIVNQQAEEMFERCKEEIKKEVARRLKLLGINL